RPWRLQAHLNLAPIALQHSRPAHPFHVLRLGTSCRDPLRRPVLASLLFRLHPPAANILFLDTKSQAGPGAQHRSLPPSPNSPAPPSTSTSPGPTAPQCPPCSSTRSPTSRTTTARTSSPCATTVSLCAASAMLASLGPRHCRLLPLSILPLAKASCALSVTA